MTLDRLDDSGQPLPTPDVQRTTLSLDLMGRYVCNTWDEAVNNGGPPFDVVVIGGGMFGGYCADDRHVLAHRLWEFADTLDKPARTGKREA